MSRTREGYFEIIEMGVVTNATTHNSLIAISHVNGVPANCAKVIGAWAGGYWATNSNIDITSPSGGLFGAASIVDVAQGTLYAYDATAIDGFSDVAQHTGPADTKPNLSTAVTDSAHQIARAYVPIGNTVVQADYPAGTRGVDAVSAVLMADTLDNEYVTDPYLGAASEWVVTAPTKQFYVDPAIVGTTTNSYLAPFEEVFGGGLKNGSLQDPGEGCYTVIPSAYDREGATTVQTCPFSPCPPVAGNYLCYQSAVITFNQDAVQPGIPTAGLGSLLGDNYVAIFTNGWFALSLADGFQKLRPSIENNVFVGLPLTGFLAENYINANVTPGVLSNYSGAYPHRATASCVNSTNPQNGCQ